MTAPGQSGFKFSPPPAAVAPAAAAAAPEAAAGPSGNGGGDGGSASSTASEQGAASGSDSGGSVAAAAAGGSRGGSGSDGGSDGGSGSGGSGNGGNSRSGPRVVQHIRLAGMGPKLLVSDASTAGRRALRWHLVVRGNTAVEFGVVPADLAYGSAAANGNAAANANGNANGNADAAARVHKALHKCRGPDDRDFAAAVGFSSTITVGSQLSVKVPVMKGSTVEVVARDGLFEAVVTNPRGAQELYWQGHGQLARTVPKPYRGAARVSVALAYDAGAPVRLALTCWAQGAFDVLGPPAALAARVPAVAPPPPAGAVAAPAGPAAEAPSGSGVSGDVALAADSGAGADADADVVMQA